MRSFRPSAGGRFTRFTKTVEEIKKEFPGVVDTKVPPPAETPPSVPKNIADSPNVPAVPSPLPPAVPVQVVNGSGTNALQTIGAIVSPLLGPIGTAALVLLLMIFMLLKREDLRSRIIRLIGRPDQCHK